MIAANKELIRAINRFNIMSSIRNSGLISRLEIARETGLSQASVTGITAELIQEGLLYEKETGKSRRGRRPMMLALNPKGAYAIGLYLTIYEVTVVIVNFAANIVASHAIPLKETYYDPETIGEIITTAVQSTLWQANFSREQISGVGIGIPALVNSSTGLVRLYPNYNWEDVNLRDIVHHKIDHPTYIENTANILTIAEQWFGEGRGIDNFLCINIEHGVGMGVVIDRQIYRGDIGVAGRLGHLTIDPDGMKCRCGKKGCFETIVGNYGILRKARMAAQKGLWQPKNQVDLNIDEVVEAAKNGVGCIVDIYKEAGHMLGIGVANMIKIFNPSKVFISGRGTLAGDLIFGSMYRAIDQVISDRLHGSTEVIVKEWNQYHYARSAGTLVLQEIYRNPMSRIIPKI